MEVAGLIFGVLGALDVCFRVSKEVNGLVRQFKTVGLDFEWASKRLDIHNVQFKNWIEFWDINENTPTRTFHTLWGPEGTNAITNHLEGLKALCTKATESQKKYKRTLEKASKPKKFQLFRGKVRYTFSGKDEFEENLNKLRSEFCLVEREAEEFFVRRNHTASRGSISKAMIDGLIKESTIMDHVVKIQQTTMHLFNGLEVKQLQLNIDLSLQTDYVLKNQFRDLEFDTQRLHKKSAKLPIIVNNAPACLTPSHQPPTPSSVFILEAGEECSFESPPKGFRVEGFSSICLLNQRRSSADNSGININYDESFFLKCPPSPKYEEYRFLVHTTGAGTAISEPRPLNEFFDNLPRRLNEYPSRTTLPITWQLDLAYTLAASVLNLQGSGWLNSFHSRNIYQRENHFRGSTIHTLRVCGYDVNSGDFRETPLDRIFHRPKNLSDPKPEIFLLGILLLEIGLARSGSAIFRDLEGLKTPDEKLAQIFCHLDHSVCPKYTDITRVCLEGDFDFDDDMNPQKILKSYICRVLEPLREQCEAMSGSRGSRHRRIASVPPKIMKSIAPKEMNFPEWKDFEAIDAKARRRTSTWDGSTFYK